MSYDTFHWIKQRVFWAHEMLIRSGETVGIDQFVHVFAAEAPPIGWHLWHMARFSDRLQSKLSTETPGSFENELWYQQELSKAWEVDPAILGVYETGMGQQNSEAQTMIQQVGQKAILEYARIVFAACNSKIQNVSKVKLDKVYRGILDYRYDTTTGSVWVEPSKESTIAQDLMFHANHSSRHLGMMEALCGLLGRTGTITV